MSDELPEGWTEVDVRTVAQSIQYGYTAKSGVTITGPKYLRITDIQDGSVDWTSVPQCMIPPANRELYRLVPGDIVFARTGATTGKSYLITSCPDALFASYLIRVRPSPAMSSQYMHLFFQSHAYWMQISDNLSGSAQPNCNASKLATLRLPLPPFPEQRRIVAKIEALLAKVRSAQERLDKVPTILKRFRHVVLAAACSGRLTADWRSASALSDVNGVPGGWREETVARVCEAVVDCPHSTPKWQPAGCVCVKTTQLKPGKLDLSSPFYVSGETFKERTTRLKPRAKDILYCREGVVGAACLVPPGVELCLGQRLMLMRPSVHIEPEFLMHALNSELTLSQVRDRTLGTTAQHVNVADVKGFSILLPPRVEQREIVLRIEAIFALANQLEARYLNAKVQIDKITHAVLAKAFRGELVPTEAELARREGRSYETAEELLARISGSGENGRSNQRARAARAK